VPKKIDSDLVSIDASHLFLADEIATTTPVLFAIGRKPRAIFFNRVERDEVFAISNRLEWNNAEVGELFERSVYSLHLARGRDE